MNPQTTTALNPGPIQSAGARTIDQQLSQAPNQDNVIRGWFRPLTVGRVQVQWKDGESKELTTTIETAGHLQPSEPERLEIAIYGDRSWKYFYFYSETGLVLENDDRCIVRNVNYRVIGRKDWSDSGFIRYRLLEDYSNAKA